MTTPADQPADVRIPAPATLRGTALIWVHGVEWGTAADLAARFNVTVWTIYKWRKHDQLTTTRINGRDYSPMIEAAAIDRAKRDATRGAPRQLDSDMIAA